MAPRSEKQCGAETRGGGRCRRPSVGGSACHLHGGRPSDRSNAPSGRRGLYSEALPPRPRAAYESVLALRGQLLGRDDVAMFQLILDEKIAELDRAATSPALDDVVARADRIAAEWKSWDLARMGREMAALDTSLRGRDRRDEVRREVRELTREKASLIARVEAEDRRHAEFIMLDDLILMLRAICVTLRKTVRDPEALEAIEAELSIILEKADEDLLQGRLSGGRKRARS